MKVNFITSLIFATVVSISAFDTVARIKSSVVNIPLHSTADTTIKLVSGVPLSPKDISPLLIGETIPAINIPGATGELFNLNKSLGEKRTILIFYRGGWCPYCSKQLAGLQEIEEDLEKLGYQIIAISTDSPENLRKSVDKSKVAYRLLSDADLNISKQFGIVYKGPKSYDKFLTEASGGENVDKLLPVPSVFILSSKGTIQFEYINPNISERISSELLIAAAKALQDKI